MPFFGSQWFLWQFADIFTNTIKCWRYSGRNESHSTFLSTKGGNADIKTMLNYFNDSSLPNATNKETKELHEYIGKVKLSQEAQIEYMKYDDLMYFAKKDDRAEAVIEFLEDFEPLSDEMKNAIIYQPSLGTIKFWLRAAAKAQSLEDWKSLVNWQD